MRANITETERRLRKLMRKLRYFRVCHSQEPAVEPDTDATVDVVIPVVEKDLDTLPLCVAGVRACVSHRIGGIYLLAPHSGAIQECAQRLGVTCVDEREVLGYGPERHPVRTADGQNRSGWIFQQLLKLSGAVGTSPWHLVIDADHILLRPHTFIDTDGRHVFYQSREFHYPYYANLSRILGITDHDRLSYVAHKMIFNRECLALFRKTLEERNPALGHRWDDIIPASLDLSSQSGFSEYEAYGHFIGEESKTRLPWRQKTLHKRPGQPMPSYSGLVAAYGTKFRSVTFPEYMKK